MKSSTIIGRNNSLLIELNGDRSRPSAKSIIARREGVIYGISTQLEWRYIKDKYPDDFSYSNETMKALLLSGLSLYNELLEMRFNDKALKDTLGIAWASSRRNQVEIQDKNIYRLGHYQIYADALQAILNNLNESKNHSYDFLTDLCNQMESRGLTTHDLVLFPDDDTNYQAMLKIIEKDLDSIKR
jgi:hypothetical protein